LIALARSTYDDVREGAKLPIASMTVAMSFSLANQLTAPILNQIGDRAVRWNVRSGISRQHQGEFLARDIDILVTGSFNQEHRDAVELHPVFEESFICVLPHTYRESFDLGGKTPPLPFIRFSGLTGMGQQIESQIVRLKLKLANVIEVESAQQQMALVALAGRLRRRCALPLRLICSTICVLNRCHADDLRARFRLSPARVSWGIYRERSPHSQPKC
jgi:DNA-binding transcriptional LysR family regulator